MVLDFWLRYENCLEAKEMFRKLILLTLILIFSIIPSCSNMHVSYVKSWPRVISDSLETTAIIRVERLLPPPITIYKDFCKEGKKEPEFKTVALGTGFVLSSDGQVVTNFHVIFPQIVKENVKIWVEFKGKKFLVKKTFSYPLYDVVILKIDASNLVPVRLEARFELERGDPVVSAGYDHKNDLIFSQGMVASLYVKPRGVFLQYKWIKTTILIYPGFSGGPVFNRYGNVVGMNNAIFPARPGYSLIIPIKYLREVIAKGLDLDTSEKLAKIAELYEKLDD